MASASHQPGCQHCRPVPAGGAAAPARDRRCGRGGRDADRGPLPDPGWHQPSPGCRRSDPARSRKARHPGPDRRADRLRAERGRPLHRAGAAGGTLRPLLWQHDRHGRASAARQAPDHRHAACARRGHRYPLHPREQRQQQPPGGPGRGGAAAGPAWGHHPRRCRDQRLAARGSLTERIAAAGWCAAGGWDLEPVVPRLDAQRLECTQRPLEH